MGVICIVGLCGQTKHVLGNFVKQPFPVLWQIPKGLWYFFGTGPQASDPCAMAKQHNPLPKTHIAESDPISTSSVIPLHYIGGVTTSGRRLRVQTAAACWGDPAGCFYAVLPRNIQTSLSIASRHLSCQEVQREKKKKLSCLSASNQLICMQSSSI